jgi:hypothetical protein
MSHVETGKVTRVLVTRLTSEFGEAYDYDCPCSPQHPGGTVLYV